MQIPLAGLLLAMGAAVALAQPTPGLLRGAAKASLAVRVSAPTEIGASQTTCRVSKEAVRRKARTDLRASPISLTDAGADITIVVDVALYRVELDDPVNMCIASVSLSAGMRTEVLLPYRDTGAGRWVDLFRSERKVARPMNGFDIEVLEAVNAMVAEFVGVWTKDQQK